MTDSIATRRSDKATELGREHGRNVGSWVIDGNTTEETARRILTGYEEDDPEVLDMEPAPLSGEWADDPTPASVYAALDMSAEDVDQDDPAGQLLTDYEIGFSEGYWEEVTRAARAALGE